MGIVIPDLADPLEVGRGRVVREGTTVAILSFGTRLGDSLRAADMLAARGLSTTVADARQVTERLDPAVRARFAEKGVRVRRTLPDPESLSKRPGIPKSWQDVFETTDRAEVERVADAKGWRINWLNDGSLQLWQEALPAFKSHPRSGERVWFNQAHYHSPECTLRWAQRDSRLDQIALIETAMTAHPEMLDNALHWDDTQISASDANHIWDVLEQAEIPVPWQPGDVLLLDNVLAMHGRRSFRGDRSILAALIRNPSPKAPSGAGA